MNNKKFLGIIFIATLLGISACSNFNKKQSNNHKNALANNTKSVAVISLKNLHTIQTISPELAKHRVIFVGESHTNYAHHLNQLEVIKSVHNYWGDKLSIGLEMIQTPYQSYLDAYTKGEITELEMLKGTQWYKRWRYDFRLYRPIFNFARKNNIQLVALNIPKELTRKITKVGITGLTKEERQRLPKYIDRSDILYRKRIEKVFGAHSHTRSKGFEYFFDAQLAWDEGMAFNASNFLKKHPDSNMVILAGGGHVIGRQGIPNRLERQSLSSSIVLLNQVTEALNQAQGDYLLDSTEIKLPAKGLMGILMDDTKQGVIVAGFSTHSAAKKAGLQKGDIIIKLGNTIIKTTEDIQLWSLDKAPKQTVKVSVKRQNKLIHYQFKLSSNVSMRH